MLFGNICASAGVCEDAGYLSSIPDNQKCKTINTDDRVCFYSCRQKTCEEMGYSSVQANDKKCIKVSLGNRKCFECFTFEEICNSKGYMHYVPKGKTCEEVMHLSVMCYNNCENMSCKDIGYYDEPRPDMKCSRKVVGEFYSNCYECRNYKCSDGGFMDIAPNGKNCTAIPYYDLKCYSLEKCR